MSLEVNAQLASQANARLIANKVKSHILSGGLPFAPLSVGWKEFKAKSGAPSDLFRFTGQYLEGIGVANYPGEGYAVAGVNRSEGDFEDIPTVLELGTQDGRIPSRPLWQWVLDQYADLIESNYREAADAALYGRRPRFGDAAK